MCIIAYAKQGIEIEEHVIRTMFEDNPDGAGIMWKPFGSTNVEIRKGFMDVESLLKAWRKIPVECEKAIHCRIATSGKISKGCCHPFPVRPKTDMMKKAVDKCYMALMHNGVIRQCTPKNGMKAICSDTMVFAAKYLYPLQKQIDKECVQDLLETFAASRLLIMRANAPTIMLGDWVEDKGVYYSNTSYKDWGCGYYRWPKSCRTSPSVSWIALDIGDDEPQKAAASVKEALECNNILFDMVDDGVSGEVSFEAYDFPYSTTKVAGYNIIDRIDDEQDGYDDFGYEGYDEGGYLPVRYQKV